MEKRLHHVGYKCSKNIDSVLEFLKHGYTIAKMGYEPEFRTKNVVFEVPEQHIYLELVDFQEENSLKEGHYHNCYEVENIEKALPHFYELGYKKISNIVDSMVWGARIIYMFSKENGFLELIER
jgi:hypothetical protein